MNIHDGYVTCLSSLNYDINSVNYLELWYNITWITISMTKYLDEKKSFVGLLISVSCTSHSLANYASTGTFYPLLVLCGEWLNISLFILVSFTTTSARCLESVRKIKEKLVYV